LFKSAFKEMNINVDGETRQATSWPDWSLTTWINTVDYWPQVWRAIQCHKTQMAIFKELEKLPNETRMIFGDRKSFTVYIALSMVEGF